MARYSLDIPYSTDREIAEIVPASLYRKVVEVVLSLADDPYPSGVQLYNNCGGCYYIETEGYYIVYGIREDFCTVFAVLCGPLHWVH